MDPAPSKFSISISKLILVLPWARAHAGTFSHLWCLQAEKLGLDVHIIDTPWGEGADEAELEKVLRADVDKKIKAVLLVHNETTCGVTSDVAQCREAMDAAGHPALFFVDGVSSIGALEFKFDDWKVDVAITGSQKALSLPPGLALTCVSDKALEARKTSTMPKFFFELDQVRPPPARAGTSPTNPRPRSPRDSTDGIDGGADDRDERAEELPVHPGHPAAPRPARGPRHAHGGG